MKLKIRTTAPTVNTKYYKTNNPFYPTYSMFNMKGNCTDYCYFRFKESNNLSKINLYTGNAENWLLYNDKYKKGTTPKVGAIMVYSKGKLQYGKDGAGHVRFIEDIKRDSNGKIVQMLISESGANSFIFRTKIIKPPFTMAGYKLQGYIYPPTDFEEDTINKPTIRKSNAKLYKAEVRQIQQILRNRGYVNIDSKGNLTKTLIGVDGVWGRNTDAAIKRFQLNNNLVVDGVVGPCTWRELLN